MDTPDAAVSISDSAAEKIRALTAVNENPSDQALRVAVKGGGCSGFQYALALDKPKDDDHVFEHNGVAVKGGGCSGFQYALALDKPKDDDHVFEHNGVAVVVDKVSMQFVFGSQVDYVDGLQGAGFTVNNPNVVAACGCGSSFQVKEDAPGAPAAV